MMCAGALLVHDVDHAGERRRLPGTGRARDHDEAAREAGQVGHHARQAQVVQLLDLERDEPERRPERIALLVDVHTEPRLARQRVGHVQLQLLLEAFAQLLRQDRVDHALQRPRGQLRVLLQTLELAVHAHRRRGPRREVEVRTSDLEERRRAVPGSGSARRLDLLASPSHFTTLAISPMEVRPMRAFSRPSSRSVIIPCSIATFRMSSADARSTVSRWISSRHRHDLVQTCAPPVPGVRARGAARGPEERVDLRDQPLRVPGRHQLRRARACRPPCTARTARGRAAGPRRSRSRRPPGTSRPPSRPAARSPTRASFVCSEERTR